MEMTKTAKSFVRFLKENGAYNVLLEYFKIRNNTKKPLIDLINHVEIVRKGKDIPITTILDEGFKWRDLVSYNERLTLRLMDDLYCSAAKCQVENKKEN